MQSHADWYCIITCNARKRSNPIPSSVSRCEFTATCSSRLNCKNGGECVTVDEREICKCTAEHIGHRKEEEEAKYMIFKVL
jgi:hypothetical protein